MRDAPGWIGDLESALARFWFSDLVRSADSPPSGATLLPRFADWLPYSAYLDAEKLFVDRDVIGFCLELHPQTGA
ncbi:MAG: TraC family protein, partial [Microbacteriaceae bacterium]|nr:TraC family protein [Microbacteriaceae bacterium]